MRRSRRAVVGLVALGLIVGAAWLAGRPHDPPTRSGAAAEATVTGATARTPARSRWKAVRKTERDLGNTRHVLLVQPVRFGQDATPCYPRLTLAISMPSCIAYRQYPLRSFFPEMQSCALAFRKWLGRPLCGSQIG